MMLFSQQSISNKLISREGRKELLKCMFIQFSDTIFTRVIFPLFWPIFSSKTGVRKLCEECLKGVVLDVTFRLGPELGILFINLKWNVSALWYRPNILTRTAEIPHSWRTKEVTDCQLLQYECVTLRTDQGEKPLLKAWKKIGVQKICERENYASKYDNIRGYVIDWNSLQFLAYFPS
jgi:hypothetical protein